MYNTYYYLYRCIIHLYYFPGHPPGGGSGIMYNTPYFVLYTGLASSAWRRRWRRAAAVTANYSEPAIAWSVDLDHSAVTTYTAGGSVGSSALLKQVEQPASSAAGSSSRVRLAAPAVRVAAPPFRWHIRLIEAYYV